LREKVSLMRKSWMFAALVGAVVLVSAAGAYGTFNKYQARPVDRQMFGTIGAFTRQPGGSGPVGNWGPSDGLVVQAREGMVATLSVSDVRGGPIQFHVLAARLPDGPYRELQPGAVTFDPGPNANAFSFTFVKPITARGGSFEIVLYAGSAADAQVSVGGGTFVVQYAQR
jgi:hypothetical protein